MTSPPPPPPPKKSSHNKNVEKKMSAICVGDPWVIDFLLDNV